MCLEKSIQSEVRVEQVIKGRTHFLSIKEGAFCCRYIQLFCKKL